MNKIFDVIIDNKSYGVYSINNICHYENGTPDNWWIFFNDTENELPFINEDKTLDKRYWKPYSKGALRIAWEIKIKQSNYSKFKYDDIQFRNITTVEMYANNKLIYQFTANDLNFALSKVGYLKGIIPEHVYNFFEPEKENGRKIYFYGLPAFIKPSVSYPGEIKIIPDYTTVAKSIWWEKYKEIRYPNYNNFAVDDKEILIDQIEEMLESDLINWGDVIETDGIIDWFRK